MGLTPPLSHTGNATPAPLISVNAFVKFVGSHMMSAAGSSMPTATQKTQEKRDNTEKNRGNNVLTQHYI